MCPFLWLEKMLEWHGISFLSTWIQNDLQIQKSLKFILRVCNTLCGSTILQCLEQGGLLPSTHRQWTGCVCAGVWTDNMAEGNIVTPGDQDPFIHTRISGFSLEPRGVSGLNACSKGVCQRRLLCRAKNSLPQTNNKIMYNEVYTGS